MITLKQLRVRADRAAAYRAVNAEERRWLFKVADAVDGLLEHWRRANAARTTEPDGE
jgi:hypothetical protein